MRLTNTISSSLLDTGVRRYGRVLIVVLGSASIVSCSPAALARSAPSPTPSGNVEPADYRSIERNLVDELNAARRNPSVYAQHLVSMLPLYDGKLLRRGGGPALETQEGATAVREAIEALKHQAPVPALSASAAMSLAARDLVSDQGRSGAVGHTAGDGSTPDVRLARYGRWSTTYDENVDYGPVHSARDVVIDLIVDDGVANRGHRRNIFDPGVRVAGVSCGPHPRYTSVCVIDQAAGFTPR